MDVAVNRTAQLLTTNHYDENRQFRPEHWAKHLAGETNFHQHGSALYGCAPGDFNDDPEPSNDGIPVCLPCSPTTKKQKDDFRFTKCSSCSKDFRTPNEYMKKRLKAIKDSLKNKYVYNLQGRLSPSMSTY
jgi:hypothetical protein